MSQFIAGQQDHLRTGRNSEVHDGCHGKDMEKRQDPEHFFFRRIEVYIPEQHLRYIGGKIALTQHGAFWPTRGPPGVLQHRDVVIEVHRHRVRIASVIHKIGKVNNGRAGIDLGKVLFLEQAKQHALDLGQDSCHRTDNDFL